MTKLLKLPTACALLAAAAVLTMPADAVEAIGGVGGEPFATSCSGARFVVGLAGQAEEWVTQIAPICVRTNAHGQWIEPPRIGPAVGGKGGRSFFIVCPVDSVVVGYYGRVGDYVDNIGLTCRREGPEEAEWSWPWPGRLGTLDLASSERGGCPPGQAANAITGAASRFIVRFGVGCREYDVMPPPAVTGARTIGGLRGPP